MKTWLAILLLLLLLFLLGVFWFQTETIRNSLTLATPTESTSVNDLPSKTVTHDQSASKGMALGNAFTCEFTMVKDGNNISGVTSVSEERGYYYSHMKNHTQNKNYYVVADGNYVYTWATNATTGDPDTTVGAVKAPIPEEGSERGSYAPFGMALDGQLGNTNDCEYTKFDKTKLSVPSNIKFFEYN